MKKDNNKGTLELIDGILLPYIKKKTKKDLNPPNNQKSLLIWDGFTGQNNDAVKNSLSELNILTVNFPTNFNNTSFASSRANNKCDI